MATIIYGDFEWDGDKAASNRRKHGVTFEEATTVFADPSHLLLADDLSTDQFLALGLSGLLHLLMVVHVERGPRIRVVSARKATTTETRTYEKRRY